MSFCPLVCKLIKRKLDCIALQYNNVGPCLCTLMTLLVLERPPPFDSTLFMDHVVIFTMHYNIGSLHEHCNCCHLTPIGILKSLERKFSLIQYSNHANIFSEFSLKPVYANYIGPSVMTDANCEGFPIWMIELLKMTDVL